MLAPDLSIPNVLKNPQLIGLVFAKLDQETSRANSAEKLANDNAANRDEWKAVADKEKLRGDTLDQALQASKEEAKALAMSRDFLRESVGDYKDETKSLRHDNDQLRSRQKYVFGVGMAVGAGAVFWSHQ